MKPIPYNKSAMMRGMDRAVDKAQKEEERMAEIFFEKGEAPTEDRTRDVGFWKDRVSKDLNIPWHKIGVPEFQKWEKGGFKKARRGAYRYENMSAEERKRETRLLSGASLRK